MYFKKYLVCFPFLLLSLAGCNKESGSDKYKVYNYDSECYFRAKSFSDSPTLDDFSFNMPFVANKECSLISDLQCYTEDESSFISAQNLSLIRVVPRFKKDGFFEYIIHADLNCDSRFDKIKIFKICLNIDKQNLEFYTDIEIDYVYYQPEYTPVNCTLHDYHFDNESLFLDYCLTTNNLMDGGTIENVSYVNFEEKYIKSTKIFEYDSNKALEINDTLKQVTDYCIELELDFNIDLYSSDNIFFTINYELFSIEYCTNINKISTILSSVILESCDLNF